MKTHQFYTHNQLRNFTYILQLADHQAIVIDPWDADAVGQQLAQLNLKLQAIINTHEHWDHTQGNQALVDRYACEVWAHKKGEGKIPAMSRSLVHGEIIELDQQSSIKIMDTPGHTLAHLCFLVLENHKPTAVFTGDTLFNAGVGNCKGGGDAETLFATIETQFQTLDDDIRVYPGHDYLQNNLQFTLKFEPSNLTAQKWLSKVTHADYRPGDIQTTIGLERQFNSFFRLDNKEIIANLNPEIGDRKAVFIALRKQRDSW
ncbi:MAG: hydroxyacylglutathione hydrolase [Enterobacterales bacterium]|nr:hydroxyacylglutathione hydrolase [Enterobacterales bacterium]